jgi:hypothetical protein
LEIKQITEVFQKKVVFCTNLEQMSKHTATNPDTKLTTMQQRLTHALKNARLLQPQQYRGKDPIQNQLVT